MLTERILLMFVIRVNKLSRERSLRASCLTQNRQEGAHLLNQTSLSAQVLKEALTQMQMLSLKK